VKFKKTTVFLFSDFSYAVAAARLLCRPSLYTSDGVV